MKIKFRHVPLKGKSYNCYDCMHSEIDTDRKTYHFYEDNHPGEGISLKLKSDMINLLNIIINNGWIETD